jgi:SsrA-binding protein
MANKNSNKSSTDKAKTGKPKSMPVISNRRAYHEYHITETFTAGLVLTGTEVKSLRAGKATLTEGFARIKDGEVWLHGMQILPYEHGTHYNHDPVRARKLLMTKREIKKIAQKIQLSGYALVPIKVFFTKCWAKVDLGLGQGKKLHDKRASEAERTDKRNIQRVTKSFNQQN